MLKNMKIGNKILIVVLTISMGAMLLLFVNSYFYMTSMTENMQQTNISLGLSASNSSKEALQKQAEEYLLKIAQKQAIASNEQLIEVHRVVNNAALYIESLYRHQDQFQGKDVLLPYQTEDKVASAKYMLAPDVEKTAKIEREVRLLSNCEYVFAPNLENNKILNNMYVGTQSGISYRYSLSNSYDEQYDPRNRDWYRMGTSTSNNSMWLDTYTDSYGNICITCVKSFADEKGVIQGVVASDIALQDMLDEITEAKIGKSGYAFLIDENMEYIAHPDYIQEGFQKELRAHLPKGSEEVLHSLSGNESGTLRTTLDGVDSYIAFSTLDETGWKICMSIEVDEVIAPAVATKAAIDQKADDTRVAMQKTLSRVMLQFVIFFSIIGLLVILVSFAVAGTITKPVQRLAKSVSCIGQGNFDVHIEVESEDEVGNLATVFNTMLTDLKQYIKDLQEMTIEKERVGIELSVAKEIQANMLPSIFPAYPERKEFDLYAMMKPAKEVGGDFYDFFLLDDDHLAIVIGDVSGKGVAAALFMVVSKTIIKNYASLGLSVEEIFTRANKDLCNGNNVGYFTTAWIGIYEISTGKLVFADAGHETPLKRTKDGTLTYIKPMKKKMVLAAMDNTQYILNESMLEVGDVLILYTDGAPEAMNKAEEFFKLERLEDCIRSYQGDGMKKLLYQVKDCVWDFVGDAPQFDDFTILGLEVKSLNKAKQGMENK